MMLDQRRSRSHIISVSDAALSTSYTAWCMLWKSLRNKSWGHMMSRNRNYDQKKYLKKFPILPKVTLESRVRYQAGVDFQDLSEMV